MGNLLWEQMLYSKLDMPTHTLHM